MIPKSLQLMQFTSSSTLGLDSAFPCSYLNFEIPIRIRYFEKILKMFSWQFHNVFIVDVFQFSFTVNESARNFHCYCCTCSFKIMAVFMGNLKAASQRVSFVPKPFIRF